MTETISDDDRRTLARAINGLIYALAIAATGGLLASFYVGWFVTSALEDVETAVQTNERIEEDVARLLEQQLPIVVHYDNDVFRVDPIDRETHRLQATPCLQSGVTAARIATSIQYVFENGQVPDWASRASYHRPTSFTLFGNVDGGVTVDEEGCRTFDVSSEMPAALVADLAANPTATPMMVVRYTIRPQDLSLDDPVAGRTQFIVTPPFQIPAG